MLFRYTFYKRQPQWDIPDHLDRLRSLRSKQAIGLYRSEPVVLTPIYRGIPANKTFA